MSATPDALRGVTLFVGGPIQHALVPGGMAAPVRDRLTLTIDQLRRAGGTVLSAHVAERFGADTASFTPDQVSVRDFAWMRECDVFVPVLPVVDGTLLRTDGTHIELGWASALGRPVVGITDQPFSESASHLLKGLSQVADAVFLSPKEVADAPERLIDTVLAALARTRAAV
ncbi:nucleoside 2-deoxyribosyltransferase [Streptomyces sp. NPDC014894]|uniref:nucleoside 2-deoxyribosyltransferase n=1 Tax=unclassified Streptomyces TaxID=2593676 RepID=UPI0036F50B20